METPAVTKKRLSSVHSSDTKPEILVSKLLETMRYHFRSHCKELPGKPDIVLPRRRKVIFIHGCYWHRHEACTMAPTPRRNKPYWDEKFERNKARDNMNHAKLSALGWKIMVVWECETKEKELLKTRLRKFLND